jgi:hypothetical protein
MHAKVIELQQPAAVGGDLAVIEHLLARGEMVAAQLPSFSFWSPEKKLAAAVFTSALTNIRDNVHSTIRRRRREALEDVDWVMSDESDWPYSFLHMCQLFGLEPEWVRVQVRHWTTVPTKGRRYSTHRHAA